MPSTLLLPYCCLEDTYRQRAITLIAIMEKECFCFSVASRYGWAMNSTTSFSPFPVWVRVSGDRAQEPVHLTSTQVTPLHIKVDSPWSLVHPYPIQTNYSCTEARCGWGLHSVLACQMAWITNAALLHANSLSPSPQVWCPRALPQWS